MTFLLGLITTEYVMLIADSAATHHHGRLLTSNKSSFGEEQAVEGRSVEEMLIKIIQLPQDALVGVVGDLDGAFAAVSKLWRFLSNGTSLSEAITMLHAYPENPEFTLAIAGFERGKPTLRWFDSKRGLSASSTGTICVAGSLPPQQKVRFARTANMMQQLPKSLPDKVAATIAALQSISVTDYLPAHGVGGAFFGAWIDSSGVQWQPDMIYQVFGPNPTGTKHLPSAVNTIFVHAEMGIAVVTSTSPNARRNFRTGSFDESVHDDDNLDIDVVQRSRSVRHMAFFSCMHRKSAILIKDNLEDHEVAWIDPLNLTQARINTSPGLFRVLDQDLPTPCTHFCMFFRDSDNAFRADSVLLP